MPIAKKKAQRKIGQPDLWGVFDRVYFAFDSRDPDEPKKIIQDHPKLLADVLRLCGEYFTEETDAKKKAASADETTGS